MKFALALITISILNFPLGSPAVFALEPSLELSQYAHKARTTRDGFLRGGVRAITQTSDGYLWLATEFGLVRFDGIRFVEWTPPSGQHLPSTKHSEPASRARWDLVDRHPGRAGKLERRQAERVRGNS